jgi:hypothetical protein
MTLAISISLTVGLFCWAISIIGWIGAAFCWLNAMQLRKPGIGLTHPRLWMELTPEGKQLRNWGIIFWIGAALGTLGAMAWVK